MCTRSSFNLPVESSPNPSTSNPKRRNRRRSKQPFILEESPVDTMFDQRTMTELLRAPTEGYAEAIVVPSILAEQFELKHNVRSANTPMDKENPWGKDGPGKDVELHLYRSMIRSLMYLTASRPDIMFAVCACARHQVTPKDSHLHAIKSIFRYLKGHPKLRLWYPKESPFDLVAYSDSDYGGATLDRKSSTEGCQFLGRKLISWQCKK
nr:uncharacterized mitochondrial protein AtMg00810-like [Tanacetum cinerariifolium]